jgi:DNA-directed RNA polymerase specialized sigma24 family protein
LKKRSARQPIRPLTPAERDLAAGVFPDALRFFRRRYLCLPRHLRDEMEAVVAVSCCRAAMTWRPGGGTAFKSWAFDYVRGAAKNFVATEGRAWKRLVSGFDLGFPAYPSPPGATRGVPDPVARPDPRADPQALALLLRPLRRQERRVIELRFGLDGGGVRELREIAAELGVSWQRVWQVEKSALARLRANTPPTLDPRAASG